MIRKLASVLILAAGTVAFSATSASANPQPDGNPAGETLPHCMAALNPCVDTFGYGVSVIRADGTRTDNYGPESYKAFLGADGNLYYTFTVDATPYGPPVFPSFDY